MARILIWSLLGFIHNMGGPGAHPYCDVVEEFYVGYGFYPYDFDYDDDIDLQDFAQFQNGYDGIDFRTTDRLLNG